MTSQEKDELWEEASSALTEHYIKRQKEWMKTTIHKIELNSGSFKYSKSAEVPGTALNQFSMDEHDGKFRIATTLNVWAGSQSVIHNNVYVLDENMQLAGKLEKIAPDERIFSTRFIGDRLYMVTFRLIDPFFVIDLSTDQPKILGELKIPGFSDYLHPYDQNHIIGAGKETEENSWGGVSTKGVKLALFDVTNVSNPKQISKIEIGQEGSHSEALTDHKAFLFDKQKNLLVIPVTEVKSASYRDGSNRQYKRLAWQGAYVLNVTPEQGFQIRGKISHNEKDALQSYFYYFSPFAVRRSLYIDNTLYTMSNKLIKANNLDNVQEELAQIKLPHKDSRDLIVIYD